MIQNLHSNYWENLMFICMTHPKFSQQILKSISIDLLRGWCGDRG